MLGELTIKEIDQSLREYYTIKEKQNNINHNELECDFVSMRIVELLKKNQEAIKLMNLEFDSIQKVDKIEIAIGPLAADDKRYS